MIEIITITDEAVSAIRNFAGLPLRLRQTVVRRPDGLWNVPVEQDLADRLASIRHPEESLSDVIVRIAAFYRSGGKLN